MSDKKTFYTLAFESSCDETSVAVLEGGRMVKSNITASQIDIHKRYGGVVPEIASRHHLENINTVIDSALGEANIKLEDINSIFRLNLESDGFSTLGGWLLEKIGSLPSTGELFKQGNMLFIVEDQAHRRILSVRIKFL